MNILQKTSYKIMLPILAKNFCGNRIPRSGSEGKNVNCYTVALDRNNSPFFVATSYKHNTLTGLKWENNTYSEEYTIQIDELEHGKIRLTHYYGLSEITFDSIYDIAWHYVTKIVYLKIKAYSYLEKANIYFFKKKKLVTKKRMELLQFMLDNQLVKDSDDVYFFGHNSEGICIFELMEKLYSVNWVSHPSGEEQRRTLELYLESFVLTGELEKNNDEEYIVTGKTISTIENMRKKNESTVKL